MHDARHDVGDRAAVLLEQRGDVAERLLCLLFDRVAGELAVLGEAALAGEKDEAAGRSGLREGKGFGVHAAHRNGSRFPQASVVA